MFNKNNSENKALRINRAVNKYIETYMNTSSTKYTSFLRSVKVESLDDDLSKDKKNNILNIELNITAEEAETGKVLNYKNLNIFATIGDNNNILVGAVANELHKYFDGFAIVESSDNDSNE